LAGFSIVIEDMELEMKEGQECAMAQHLLVAAEPGVAEVNL